MGCHWVPVDVYGHCDVRHRCVFGLMQYWQTKALPFTSPCRMCPRPLGNVQNYLFQQGKFLAILWLLIGSCIFFYFKVLEEKVLAMSSPFCSPPFSASWAATGWRGSASASTPRPTRRTSFAALRGNPILTVGIPLRSRHERRLLLVAVELFFMICILIFLPNELIGPCFIGFAIGESLGASVLRICGGIFTKCGHRL